MQNGNNSHSFATAFAQTMTIKTKSMEDLKDRILQITKCGIDFKSHLIGDLPTGGFLKEVKMYASSTEDVENWIIIREMGHQCSWLNNASYIERERYSNDVSTIIFEQYFLYNSISFLFQEIQRITKGVFKYEVIDEFYAIYDSNNNRIDENFWKRLDELKGDSEYICKYKIMDRYIELKYRFCNYDWTDLDYDFVSTLIQSMQPELAALHVHCLVPEEFITFVSCNDDTKSRLENEFGIHFMDFKPSTAEANKPEDDHIATIPEILPTHEEEAKKWWEFWK